MKGILSTTQSSNKTQENLQSKFDKLAVEDVDKHTDFEMKENLQEHYHEQTGIGSKTNLAKSDHHQFTSISPITASTGDGNDQSFAKNATSSSDTGNSAIVSNKVDDAVMRNIQENIDEAFEIDGYRFPSAYPDPSGIRKEIKVQKKFSGFPFTFLFNLVNDRTKEAEEIIRASGQPVISKPTCGTCYRRFDHCDSLFRHQALHKVPNVQKLDELTQERLDHYWEKAETGFVCIFGRCRKEHEELAQAHWHVLGHADPGRKIRDLIPVPKPEFFMVKANNLIHCIGCSRVFESSQDFENHYILHLGDFPFACKVCCKPFKQKSKLVYHFCYECNERKKKQDLVPSK